MFAKPPLAKPVFVEQPLANQVFVEHPLVKPVCLLNIQLYMPIQSHLKLITVKKKRMKKHHYIPEVYRRRVNLVLGSGLFGQPPSKAD